MSVLVYIVGSAPLIKEGGGGYDLPKIEILGRVQNALQERARGDKPEKEGLMQKWGGGGLPLYSSVQSHLLCVHVGKVRFPLYLSDLQSFELAM